MKTVHLLFKEHIKAGKKLAAMKGKKGKETKALVQEIYDGFVERASWIEAGLYAHLYTTPDEYYMASNMLLIPMDSSSHYPLFAHICALMSQALLDQGHKMKPDFKTRLSGLLKETRKYSVSNHRPTA